MRELTQHPVRPSTVARQDVELPCAHWCRICPDIQRELKVEFPRTLLGSMERDEAVCGTCPDCSPYPEWSLSD